MAPNPPQSGPRDTRCLCEGSVWFAKEVGAAWAPPSGGQACMCRLHAGSRGCVPPGHLGFCKSACDYTQGLVPVRL